MKPNRTRSACSRRRFLKSAAFGAGALGLSGLVGGTASPAFAAPRRRKKPNVLFILIDDQMPGEMGAYGGDAPTPHMDSIATDGVKFTRGYTSSPTCTPTRYTCLTGEYASRTEHPFFIEQCPPGAMSVVTWNTNLVPERCMAQAFKGSGYTTGMVGKWHVSGHGKPGLAPIARGADPHTPEVAAAMKRNQRTMIDYVKSCGFDYAASLYWNNVSNGATPGCPYHNQEWITQGGLDFIEQNKDKPFFLYWATSLLHAPYKGSLEAEARLTAGGWIDKAPDAQPARDTIDPRLKAAGVDPGRNNVRHVVWLDDAVGALLAKLEELELDRDTLVIYLSDQPRIGKGVLYEEGARTPFMARWTGTIPAGQVSDALAGNIDVAPTVFDVCDITPPRSWTLDGKSMIPLVTKKTGRLHDALFLEMGYTRAVVTGRYKYIALRYPDDVKRQIERHDKPRFHMLTNRGLQKRAMKQHPAYEDFDQLYDLKTDPDEKHNLAADPAHAETLKSMKERMAGFLKTFPKRPFGELTG